MIVILWIVAISVAARGAQQGRSRGGDSADDLFLGVARSPFGPTLHLSHLEGNFSMQVANRNISALDNYVDTGQENLKKHRAKRGVLHLYNMVSCATGCNPIIYKGYGCYCGFLGAGYAMDPIDGCCKRHDWCYNKANCKMFSQYFVPYYWKCFNNKPLCAIEHGKYGGAGSCSQRLCECDRVLSECLSKYPCPSSRALCTSSPLRFFQNALMLF